MTTQAEASAYWTVGRGRGEIRHETVPEPNDDQVLVRTLASGVSRGSELLVHHGQVPAEVASSMRAPHQQGELPGPVKYGYLAVGLVVRGPDHLVGRRVFCLHPHQTEFVVPADEVTIVPDGVPTNRAVLAGTVETALNALWDAGPRMADRVAVIGAGMVGLSVALLLRRHPLERLQVVETAPDRRSMIERLGLCAVSPQDAAGDCDLVFHTSASTDGLSRGLELLGLEGELIELSWYGTRAPTVPLGGDFHARRLTIRASQVGQVSPARRARRSHAQRMAAALEQLHDDSFDLLLGDPLPFDDLPRVMQRLADGELTAPCQVISYPTDDPTEQE